MCDLNWCPVCEKSIACESDSLYCSTHCLLMDTKAQVNPNKFLSFLNPKSLLRRKKQESSIPHLSKSIYTSSSLSTRSLSDSDYYQEPMDDLELPECCDYCDNVKKHENKQSSLFDDVGYQTLSSPVFIPVP